MSEDNATSALAACWVAGAIRAPETVGEALETAWLPGRFDRRTVRGREVILDGAHNADAAHALARSLPEGPIRLVTNMLAGHEVEGFYSAFGDRIVGAELAPIDAPRALPLAEAARRLGAMGILAEEHPTIAAALEAALAADDGLVVVTGSNYLVGDAIRLLD